MNDKRLNGGCANKLKHQYDSSCPLYFCKVSFWLPSDSKRLKDVPLLNSSLETLLYSTFPPLSYPSTSPEATNTDVLISILLHCLFAHGYFTSLILNGEGPRIQSCFPGFKAGSAQDGALRRGKEQQCGYPPFTPQPENIPQDFSHSFQGPNGSEKAACVGYSFTSNCE